MAQPENLLYSKEHEWVKVDGDVATIGITDYAQNSLGDIVYVELPKVGTKIAQFGNVGVIESVKAVSDLFTPISGEIVGDQCRRSTTTLHRSTATVRRGLAHESQARIWQLELCRRRLRKIAHDSCHLSVARSTYRTYGVTRSSTTLTAFATLRMTKYTTRTCIHLIRSAILRRCSRRSASGRLTIC